MSWKDFEGWGIAGEGGRSMEWREAMEDLLRVCSVPPRAGTRPLRVEDALGSCGQRLILTMIRKYERREEMRDVIV